MKIKRKYFLLKNGSIGFIEEGIVISQKGQEVTEKVVYQTRMGCKEQDILKEVTEKEYAKLQSEAIKTEEKAQQSLFKASEKKIKAKRQILEKMGLSKDEVEELLS